MKLNLEHICTEVIKVAKLAAEFIVSEREVFTADKIEFKGHQNFVSYVDKKAEEIIIEKLKQILPQANIIAEEGHSKPHNVNELSWVIDPLDGTTNFIHGLPPYCVSIALVENKKPLLGVIHVATSGECFYTWKNAKTYINGKEIKCSEVDKVENSLVITGMAYNLTEKTKNDFIELFDYFNRKSHGARRLGSAATNLAYLAAGRADCFYQLNLSPWDVAAGAIIAQNAGCTVTDFDGGDDFVFGKSILVATPKLHKEFFDLITTK